MKTTVIGGGDVGLVSGGCFAELGGDVVCLEGDEERIAQLPGGSIPVYGDPAWMRDAGMKYFSVGRRQ